MHWYKRNIGDYSKKAGRLSLLQHGVYTLLIDACYDRERFPTMDEAIDWTWASSQEEIEAVEFVLRRFFTLEDGVYVQQRIKEEIEEYRKKAENNRRIALEREAARKQKSTSRAPLVDDADTKRHLTSNQEPRTNNQEPNKKYSPDDLAVAEEMLGLIRVVNPNFKQPNLDRWANSVRLMRQRDGRPISEIRALFAWANQDSFWSANILSPDKLREKYDQLIARRRQAAGMPASPQRFDPMARLTDRSWASGVLDQPEEPDYIDVEYRRATA